MIILYLKAYRLELNNDRCGGCIDFRQSEQLRYSAFESLASIDLSSYMDNIGLESSLPSKYKNLFILGLIAVVVITDFMHLCLLDERCGIMWVPF